MSVKQWKARAVLGDSSEGQLVLARMVGDTVVVILNGERLEITIACIANNSVALSFETAKKNLILRKELEK